MTDLRDDALAAWRAGVEAAHPGHCVSRHLAEHRELEERLRAALVVSTGKAAVSMAAALGADATGFVLAPHGSDRDDLAPGLELLYASHPVPDRAGIQASRRILEAVESLGANDLLVYLVSGGTSSMFEVPDPRVSVPEIIGVYDALVRSGGDIQRINTVRSALSVVKAGRLAAAAWPAPVLTLALSDVAGDHPATIGSGPTAPSAAATYGGTALDVAEELGLAPVLSGAVRSVLADPAPCGAASVEAFRVLASAITARTAAADELERRGYGDRRADDGARRLVGEAVCAAGVLAAEIRERLAGGGRSGFAAAGETTVRVPEQAGTGGRNQHLAATLALELAGIGGFAAVVAGTDGRDGNSDAAGAVVDGGTASRAAAAGYPLERALERFDTTTALDAARDTLRTGPTGTNVEDLVAVAIDRDRAR